MFLRVPRHFLQCFKNTSDFLSTKRRGEKNRKEKNSRKERIEKQTFLDGMIRSLANK